MEEKKKLSSEELAKLREQLKREAATIGTEPVPEQAGQSEAEAETVQETKSITVEISEDKMSATVRLAYPKMDEKYSVPEVINMLRKDRVVLGIKTDAIMEMINFGLYEEDIVVAEGKEPEPGIEGYYEFTLDMDKREEPDIREDGTVDYTSMNRLCNVAEGDRIAIYHPAIQGKEGFDVSGVERAPKPMRDQPPLRGKYIRYDVDTMEYFATIAGKISRSGNNIEILSVHEINDNLDLTYGNVEFYGDIVINGNVEAGAVIRAGRDVTINGTVSGGKIFAGGDVVLTKGAQGQSKISARGSVFSEFIEYTDVDARGEIHSNYLLNAQINSLQRVFVDGKKGYIIGGNTHGLKGVELRRSGNYTEPKTMIHAGFSDEDYEKYDALNQKEEKINNELALIVSEMTELLVATKERGATQKQKDRIFELNKKKDDTYAGLDSIRQDKKELAQKMTEGTGAYIEVRQDAFRNTTIAIDDVKLLLQKEESCTRYILKRGEIERTPAHLN